MIQSITRALEILDAVAHAGGAAPLGEIAAKTGLKTTTAHNILRTLQDAGYIRRRPGDMRYHLGDRILNLARVVGDDDALRRRLRPTLEQMAARTSETVFLAVPSGDEVFFLDAIESPRSLRASSQRGERLPMAGSAIGLLFLAFLPALRRRMFEVHAHRIGPGIEAEIGTIAARGYALDRENWSPGLNCVAVPWRDDGEVRAGFGLAGPSSRLTASRLDEMAQIMRELASDSGGGSQE
ncbi:IclR family transcriptional regulator [Maritimibacter alkaliphilus]|uniref:IclR family transcriptional regulator n=1 Tax=Maritimibacter alkaliphilus TaxID=404236 RepID=UPI001C94A026|nr:IclR family transcriptional regulator [Maritimibacter alkaliphilus]MBY6091773.1 IclR family transcriptional regulator [Maritimibacter alkaliphilus]